MYNLFLGIDPGASGTITILNEQGKIMKSIKMPDNLPDAWVSLNEFKENIEKGELFGMIEQVWAFPGNGPAGALTFGFNSCLDESILYYNKVPFEKVVPTKWMKYFGMVKLSKETKTIWKNRLYHKCQQLFPGEKLFFGSIFLLTYSTSFF